MQLKGKNIVITGGSGGIGSLLAKEFSALGASIIVMDRVAPAGSGAFIEGDLSTLEGIQAVAEKLKATKVDVLINLAGVQYFGMADAQSPQNTALTYMVNLLAPVMLTQAVLPAMKERGFGHIVNIGSIFGSINFAHFASYSSSKAGLKGFSEALRREVTKDNIHVTYIAPRAVKTPLNSGKVMELAQLTKMKMDEPSVVVEQIVKAVINEKKDVYIGSPEKYFVRLNALLPRLVDGALKKNDLIARKLLEQK